jgi:polyisoprenoid-binding protein YceI
MTICSFRVAAASIRSDFPMGRSTTTTESIWQLPSRFRHLIRRRGTGAVRVPGRPHLALLAEAEWAWSPLWRRSAAISCCATRGTGLVRGDKYREGAHMAEATVWNIDPAHSSVEFAVKHMMFTTVRGRFKDVRGAIHVDEQNPDRSSVEVEINAVSIDTGVADRDTHLRSADFLDVENNQKITFRSKRIQGAMKKPGEHFTIVGDLMIRGKTMEVTLECEYEGTGTDPWGGTRAGARANARIDRREWGLKWNQTLETGGILVANEVRIEVEVQAVKAAPVKA